MERRVLPVSVIIPTLNRPNALFRTIETLLKMDTVPAQLVVVDQTAKAEDRQKIQRYLKDIRVIPAEYYFLQKPSSTRARNIGIEGAKENILLFMDDDVDVNPDTLENIYRYMRDEKNAMVGVIDETLPESTGRLGYLFAMKSWKNRRMGHVTPAVLGRYPDRVKGVVPTMWAMGFCFALKKDRLDAWQLRFDEKLTGYAYAEDLDITYAYYKQAKAEGLRCLLAEDLKVKHLESKEYRIPNSLNTYKYVINREYLSYKHGMSVWARLCIRWANFGQFLLRLRQGAGAGDIWRAQCRCDMIRKQLRQGMISEEFYKQQ